MKMKHPVHPGLLVKECLDDLGLSVAEAAKGLGVTCQQLHNVIAGHSNVTPEMALHFEKAFGSTAATWLQMQINHAETVEAMKAARRGEFEWEGPVNKLLEHLNEEDSDRL